MIILMIKQMKQRHANTKIAVCCSELERLAPQRSQFPLADKYTDIDVQHAKS